MEKMKVKAHLIAQQRALIGELNELIQNFRSVAVLDANDTIDPEDQSHQFEWKEMEQMNRVQLNRAQRGLDLLESLDFSPKSQVRTGAIVATNSLSFIIGYATMPFDLDGIRYVGISVDSPIYSIMSTKKQNDTFEYAGKMYTINTIQ